PRKLPLSAHRQPPPSTKRTNPHSILIVSNRAGSHANFDGEVSELEAQLAHPCMFSIPAAGGR
ncbi:HAD-superfamily phosphatase subfamily IIIA, partial [Penicillium cf. griseofulvum]